MVGMGRDNGHEEADTLLSFMKIHSWKQNKEKKHAQRNNRNDNEAIKRKL